jgi:AraC family transcriptional regulator
MECLQKMNDSLDYLEEHLCEEVNIEEVAKVACLSKFHFQRMFHILTDVTVAEYLRKRRLTLAAQELATYDSKVIDVALKYGYSTPESFSKAFKKLHGINPSEVRNCEVTLKAYPRFFFQIQLKGAERMNYKIIERDEFKIVGKSIRVSTVDGENFKAIPEFWEECCSSGFYDELTEKMGDLGVMGVCGVDCDSQKDEFTYMVAIEKPESKIDFDVVEREIPASTWAVFESIGPMPDAIQEVWKRIFAEWFPSTGYEHAGTFELEIYYPGNPNDADYKSEVWVPIIKE